MKTNQFLILGANSHLGKTFIELLSSDKSNRILLVTHKDEDFSKYLEKGRIEHVSNIDLTSEYLVKPLRVEAREFFTGPFTILAPLGYLHDHEPFETTDIDTAKKIIESNFISVYISTYTFLPVMIEKGGGNLVAFSSNAARYAYPYMAAFDASKAAVENFVQSIANEYSKNNIQANAIALPCINHEQTRALIPHGDFAHWINLKEVCEETLALLTDNLKYMNGNTIHIFKYSETFFGKGYFERIRK